MSFKVPIPDILAMATEELHQRVQGTFPEPGDLAPVHTVGEWRVAADRYARVRKTVEAISFRRFAYDVRVHVRTCGCRGGLCCRHLRIEIVAMVPHRNSGEPIPLSTSRLLLADDPPAILQTVRDALHKLVMHEVDEALHFEDRRVFDPHAPMSKRKEFP